MCGITGVIDASPEGERTTDLLNRLQLHRGPDHVVTVREGPFVLGNTRLAIQDPTPSGNQPFESADGRFVCVFNGEIYNFRELAAAHGLGPNIRCDGAVIPELWSRFGSECLSLFHGMWGLALVDRQERTLTLARDPFGIKPLHWRALGGGRLAFASEPRALAAVRPTPDVDRDAVASFLRIGGVAANASPFTGIEALAPNETVVFDSSSAVRSSVVADAPVVGAASAAGDEGPARAAELFCRSVDIHLRSDVPAALLLSGGVDSGAIASAAASLGARLHCLTVADLSATNEVEAAAATARSFGHEHEVVPAQMDAGGVQEFFAAMQRPTVDGLNTFVVSRAVRTAGYKVALSGVGADEVLGGYRHFRMLRALPVLRLARHALNGRLLAVIGAVVRRTPAQLQWPKVEQLISTAGPLSPWQLDLTVREVMPRGTVKRLTGVDSDMASVLDPGCHPLPPAIEALIAAEVGLYLQPVLLPDADAFSMAASIELRVPFLDRDFARAAVALTARARAHRGKQALATALGDPFLVALARRPKQGFALPMAAWMRDGLLAPVVQALNSPSAPVWDHVDRSSARELVLDASVSAVRWSPLWALAALNGWLESVRSRPTA